MQERILRLPEKMIVIHDPQIDPRKDEKSYHSRNDRILRPDPRGKICNKDHVRHPRDNGPDQHEPGMFAHYFAAARLPDEDIGDEREYGNKGREPGKKPRAVLFKRDDEHGKDAPSQKIYKIAFYLKPHYMYYTHIPASMLYYKPMDVIAIFIAKYLYLLVLLIGVVYFFFQSRKVQKDMIISAVIIGPIAFIFSRIGGFLYYDPRPFVVGHFIPLISHVADNGFHSDHVLLTGAAATVVWFFNKKLGLVLWALALLIGWARVYTGVHHITDIIGSIVFVLIAAMAQTALLRANRKRTSS